MMLDEKDSQILKLLLSDSRQSARQLSLRMGLSTVTTLSRIKKLEEKKIIQGYAFRIYRMIRIVNVGLKTANLKSFST